MGPDGHCGDDEGYGGVEMRMWKSSSRCGAGRLEAEQPPWRNGCGESFGERKQGRWQGVEKGEGVLYMEGERFSKQDSGG